MRQSQLSNLTSLFLSELLEYTEFLFFPWLVVSLDTNSIVNVIKTKQREDGEAVTERSLMGCLFWLIIPLVSEG